MSTVPRWKFGYEVPKSNNHEYDFKLDKFNKNTKWKYVIEAELYQQMECETCKDLGHKSKAKPPSHFKKISIHLVHCIKYSGCHKARLAADGHGHLTNTPLFIAHSRVVSLKYIVLVLFLEQLNGLESWGVDAGNACLEAKTKEKDHAIVGPEFVPIKD